MNLKIDESWYQKPDDIALRTSSGGVVCRIQDDQVWVALAREESYQMYVLPKGGVEEGESLEEASAREIEEETGLADIVRLGKVGICERLTYNKAAWATTHFYLYYTTQIEGIPTDQEYHCGVWWHAIDDLSVLFWPEQKRLVEEKTDEIVARIRDYDRQLKE
jgi:8-oxo-dGTP pyrophosphatase MutT (NUDIX family)